MGLCGCLYGWVMLIDAVKVKDENDVICFLWENGNKEN